MACVSTHTAIEELRLLVDQEKEGIPKYFVGILAYAMKVPAADLSTEFKALAWREFGGSMPPRQSEWLTSVSLRERAVQFAKTFAQRLRTQPRSLLGKLRNELVGEDYRAFFERIDKWSGGRTTGENEITADYLLTYLLVFVHTPPDSANALYARLGEQLGSKTPKKTYEKIRSIYRKLLEWADDGCPVSIAAIAALRRRNRNKGHA